MIKGQPQFLPWSEDTDPPDYWEADDYEAMRRRLRAYWGGTSVDDALRTWNEEKHPRVLQGEHAGEFGTATSFDEKLRALNIDMPISRYSPTASKMAGGNFDRYKLRSIYAKEIGRPKRGMSVDDMVNALYERRNIDPKYLPPIPEEFTPHNPPTPGEAELMSDSKPITRPRRPSEEFRDERDAFKNDLPLYELHVSPNTTYPFMATPKGIATCQINDVYGVDDPTVELHWLIAHDRGAGRAAMELMIRAADRNGVTIVGYAVPLAPVAGKKMTISKLEKFYEQFGFATVGRRDKDGYKKIVRKPQRITDAIREWNEEKHERVQGGSTGGQFGSGTGPMTARKEKSGRAAAALAGKHKAREQGKRAKEQAAQQASMRAEATALAQETKAKEDQTAAKKGKKVSRKEDFDKAKVRIRGTESDHEAIIAKWNEKIGMDPAEFEKLFTGGLEEQVDLSVGMRGNEFLVSGNIRDEQGRTIGNFDRDIKPDKHEAYSAYFKIERAETGGDIGKKILGGNIEAYEAMGIDTVKVTANIDVGGYAWAKYGYVPTASAWSELSGELERKLDRETESGSGSRRGGGDTMEAEEWDMLSSDQQEETQRRWMRDSRDEFMQSEIESWRDSGRPLEEAKKTIVSDWDRGSNDWALEKLQELRKARLDDAKESGEEITDFALNDEQILGALSIDEYESRYEDGTDDVEFTWDETTLAAAGELKAKGQMELPGIEPPDYSQILSNEERGEITDALFEAFNAKAEEDAPDIDPPDYLGEQIEEYQDEYWGQKDDEEKLRLAVDYGQADIEIESEDEEEPEMDLTEEEKQDPEISDLYDLVRSGDPKSIWQIADSKLGKKLLLGSGWSGVLNLKDKEAYARFKAYVGKRK